VPTLLITGESDIPDVHSHMGAIQAGIAGAQRVVLPHAGHFPHLEVPEIFSAEVRKFLR
jgi:3-oxoadipate enol-lactonase